MTATFIHDGDAIDYTPAEDLPAGSVVTLPSLIGVTKRPLKAGESGSLHVTGVFQFPKDPAEPLPMGISVHWDLGEQRVTGDPQGPLVGITVSEGGPDTDTILVRLKP